MTTQEQWSHGKNVVGSVHCPHKCLFFLFFLIYLNWHLHYSHIHTCHAHSITFQQPQKHYQDAKDCPANVTAKQPKQKHVIPCPIITSTADMQSVSPFCSNVEH